MRKTFFDCLHQEMKKNRDIFFLTGDLGYGLADNIMKYFPERAINCGAAEVAMIDIAIGLALEGKIPFCYSITPFLLYRPFEQIRTYIDHEKINVKLIGSGRDQDYKHDGFSHDASDAWELFNHEHGYEEEECGILPNIQAFWPDTDKQIPKIVNKMVKSKTPEFLSLRR